MRGGTASTTVGTTFAGDAVGGVIWTVGEGGTARVYAASCENGTQVRALKVFVNRPEGREDAATELQVYDHLHSFKDPRRR